MIVVGRPLPGLTTIACCASGARSVDPLAPSLASITHSPAVLNATTTVPLEATVHTEGVSEVTVGMELVSVVAAITLYVLPMVAGDG